MAMTNHQPTGQQAPANATSLLSCKYLPFLFSSIMAIAFAIWLLILLSHHSPQAPIAPTITLVSFTAKPLFNTTPATWNLTICLSNPNPKYTIYYNHFNVSLYYHNNNSNNSNTVFVGGDGFGKYVQPANGRNLVSSHVSFSTHNLGKRHVVERFLNDQKKGSVGVIIEASYAMNFNKDDGWKMEANFIIGVNVYFKKSSGNKTGLGSVSGLPRDLQFYNPS